MCLCKWPSQGSRKNATTESCINHLKKLESCDILSSVRSYEWQIKETIKKLDGDFNAVFLVETECNPVVILKEDGCYISAVMDEDYDNALKEAKATISLDKAIENALDLCSEDNILLQLK